jgi:gluconokinase
LRVSDEVKLVHLAGDRPLIAERLRHRGQHFMNPALLPTQFDALETPAGEEVLTVDADRTPIELVAKIRRELDI